MMRVSSRPRLVSDADRAFKASAAEDDCDDYGYGFDIDLDGEGDADMEHETLFNQGRMVTSDGSDGVDTAPPSRPSNAIEDHDVIKYCKSSSSTSLNSEDLSQFLSCNDLMDLQESVAAAASGASIKRKRIARQSSSHQHYLTPISSCSSFGKSTHTHAAEVAQQPPLKTEPNVASLLLAVPPETLVQIAAFLPLSSVHSLSSTCVSLRGLLSTSPCAVVDIWQREMTRRFARVFAPPPSSDDDTSPSSTGSIEAEGLTATLARLRGQSARVESADAADELMAPSVAEYSNLTPGSEYVCDVSYVDGFHLPIPGLHSTTESQTVNLPLLTSMLPPQYPQCVDAMTFKNSYRLSRHPFKTYYLRIEEDDCGASQVGGHKDSAVVPIVQFRGDVGRGDQSIRSDQPFPSSLRSNMGQTDCHDAGECCNSSCKNGFGVSSLSSWMKAHTPRVKMKGFSCKGRGIRSSLSDEQEMADEGSNAHSLIRSLHLPGHCDHDENLARPFVVPTIISDSIRKGYSGTRRRLEVDLTPRLVAYFEVTIVKTQQKDGRTESNSRVRSPIAHRQQRAHPQQLQPQPVDPQPPHQNMLRFFPPFMSHPLPLPGGPLLHHNPPFHHQPNLNQPRHECVAIGLSTKSFNPHDRLPGWDLQSFGYHGDDGGIFHGRGDMLRRYGPSFGPGDTVGCGLQYPSEPNSLEDTINGGKIFFTKNGKFLGWAFDDKVKMHHVEAGLYPTVGIDTECPVFVNFGERAFKFDICKFTSSSGNGGCAEDRRLGRHTHVSSFFSDLSEGDLEGGLLS